MAVNVVRTAHTEQTDAPHLITSEPLVIIDQLTVNHTYLASRCRSVNIRVGGETTLKGLHKSYLRLRSLLDTRQSDKTITV